MRQAAWFSKEDSLSRSPTLLNALGRRAREAVPDSRAEAKGLGSAKRGERPVRGRRHLVVKSQVMRQSRQKRESAGGFERTASHVAFLPHPRECAGKRIFGRKSKTLEIISLKCRHAVRTRDLRPAQSAALEAYLAQN